MDHRGWRCIPRFGREHPKAPRHIGIPVDRPRRSGFVRSHPKLRRNVGNLLGYLVLCYVIWSGVPRFGRARPKPLRCIGAIRPRAHRGHPC